MARARAQKPKKDTTEQDAHLKKSPVDIMADPHTELLNLQQAAGNQAVSTQVAGELPASVQDVTRSSGRPLEPGTKAEMEAHFKHDFDEVRLHTDSKANKSAQELKAKAYTAGSDIVFNEGQHAPNTPEGKKLLAHELAHVMQQRSVAGQPGQNQLVNKPGDRWEQAADAATNGHKDMSLPSGAPPVVQRQADDDSEIDRSSGIFRSTPGAVGGVEDLDDRNVDRFQFIATRLNDISTRVKKENMRTRQVMRRLFGVERKR